MTTDDDTRRAVAKAVRACTLPSGAVEGEDDALLIRRFEELAFDSLAFMEFCVSIYLDTGIEMDAEQAQAFQTPLAVAEFLGSRR